MSRDTTSVEANGIEVKATPHVVWLKGDETVECVSRPRLRHTATVERVSN